MSSSSSLPNAAKPKPTLPLQDAAPVAATPRCPQHSLFVDIHAGITGNDLELRRRPSFGLLIHAGDGVAQVGRQICRKCDTTGLSPLSQTLGAYSTALRFVHALSIPASRSLLSHDDNRHGIDDEHLRPVILRFHSNCNLMAHIGTMAEHPAYGKLIQNVQRMVSCIVLNGNRVKIFSPPPRVRGKQYTVPVLPQDPDTDVHREQWAHASSVAMNTAGRYEDESNSLTHCIACNRHLRTIDDLAQHFRRTHLGNRPPCEHHNDCFELKARTVGENLFRGMRRGNKSL